MKVNCPHCNQMQDVTGMTPDSVVYCTCGRPFRVPNTGDMPPALPEAPQPIITPVQSVSPTPPWAPPPGPVFAPAYYYPSPPFAPRATETPGTATAALVLGILSFVLCLGILGSIPAVICGHSAIKTIRSNPNYYSGHGMAVAGLVLGWINIGLAVLVGIPYLIIFIAAIASEGHF